MRLAASDNGDLGDCLEVQHTIDFRQTSMTSLLAVQKVKKFGSVVKFVFLYLLFRYLGSYDLS